MTLEWIKDIIPVIDKAVISSGLICSLCRSRRICYANLTLHWSLLAESGKCNLFITIKNTKLHFVFDRTSITASHLSLWAITRFFSYKKRANPLSVFAMRARTSAMSVSVAAGDFNLTWKPHRNKQTTLTSSVRHERNPREGWADIENWNYIINFNDDGNMKKLLYFQKRASIIPNSLWNADWW